MNTNSTLRNDPEPALLLKVAPQSISPQRPTQLARIIEIALRVTEEGGEEMISIGEQHIRRRAAEQRPPILYLVDTA